MHQIREERIQLQEQHFFLEKLIEASPSGIILLDYDDFITYINPAARQLLDLSDAHLQQPLQEVGHAFIEEIGELKLGESQIVSLHGLRQYKCQLAQFLHRGFHRKFLLIEELSKELLATEKRAYGKVIRMMAHEVNNSIGAINSILHSVREIEEEQQRADSEQIISVLDIAIDRNNRLNQFMRNFADVIRLPEPKQERVDLNSALQNVANLFRQQAAQREIQFDLDLHEAPLMVQLDIAQMEQVWVNIIKNALDSIEAYGKVRITTTVKPLRIIIADNGNGIPPEAARKLFTPFFSTKP
ncbi:MAG: ATP-binding protein, partial [Bacteroidota bacterium]